MEDETNVEVSWHSPSGWKAAMEDLRVHTDTYRQLLNDSSGTVPSAELVGALYALVAKTQKLLELARRGFDDDSALGRPETNGQDEPWRGQESGRSDNLPGCIGYNPRYALLAKAKAQAKAAFRKGRRSRPRRRKGRR